MNFVLNHVLCRILTVDQEIKWKFKIDPFKLCSWASACHTDLQDLKTHISQYILRTLYFDIIFSGDISSMCGHVGWLVGRSVF